MCNPACVEFVKSQLSRVDISGKSVIEVGSREVSGSIKQYIDSLKPASYLGVDIAKGPGVEEICSINDLVSQFGKESFDIVISTEVLEHILDWRNAISNLKNILKHNGLLLLTTRSKGYPYHGFPFDYWRFETYDAEEIFSDLEIHTIEKDHSEAGIFVKACKSLSFLENTLSHYELYSIITDKRCKEIRMSRLLIGIIKNITMVSFLRMILPHWAKKLIKSQMLRR